MRSIVYARHGASGVMTLVDRPVPEPGLGEVRVRVVVSGVNPTDWRARAGGPGAKLPFPEVTPNQDGAGIVDAVGAGVEGLVVGDRVWLYMSTANRPTGTAQEYTVVPATRAVRLPAAASFDLGASLGVPAMTAHRALTTHERGPDRLGPGVLAGMTVLVAGGAGAVGHAAIQLARWAGATVIATVSSAEKAALAIAAGAHHAVDYRADDAVEQVRRVAPDGVDIVVEVSIAQNSTLLERVLKNHGVVSIYATNGGDEAVLSIRANTSLNARYQFVLLYTLNAGVLDSAASDLTAALRDEALTIGAGAGLPITRFPLELTAAAHDAVEAATVGKVLIDVSLLPPAVEAGT
ncbi:NADPH:quinone reductase [Curtobacterium sp. MCBA15_008]|uniref:NADPH:quinone reductase n=1 Tax=Curtobacterium sp. MCBA15_008 TaxID=1898736 RepID=UPI0008DE63CD|nr:NADPH:quinone reductase [Curtobacterium sp. MCBA15_008]OII09069.1 NADPH:quinone reductase [Curtobacterium sp. MCBA15_008]